MEVKQFKYLILTYLFSAPVSLAAEWSGQLGMETRLFTETAAYAGQHGHNSSLFFQPEFYHENNEATESFTLVPFIRLDQHDDERSHADIRELTWLKVMDNLEIRLGVRKVFWGVTESQHLVDIINQTDAVDSVDGEEKLGQPMVNLSYITELGSFDVFLLPYFRERTFAGREGRLRSQPYVDTTTTLYESADKEKHLDYAFRWAHSMDEWDFGASYFRGTSRDPRFVVGTDSVGRSVLNPYYDLITQIGVDVQATFDSWLWKLEGIHRSGLSGNGDSSYNAFTAGFEYTFYSAIGEATDIGLVFELLRDDRGNSATTPFQKDVMLGLRFNLNDEQSTEALIGMVRDLDNDSVIYSVEASRRLSEHLKLTIESRQYSNIPINAALYSYSSDDFVQFELSYYF